ncbi:Leucine-rich repeats and WD repeat domain-containing protein 1 [Desmophyllum pertusum]|uniref:Leucine-rich repeats and WD repeat domain-containing protein 1 n=1 Tax=Desmophyllum pertusum TaxID=174260 RepID=A0A9W9ZU68_9CNID|nr:Leucine-rich repeats and WD repeat domain-containing protein 1 [Desmophyllum pertusum]
MSSSLQITVEDIKKWSGREDLSEIRQLNLSSLGLSYIPGELLQQLPNRFPNLERLNVTNNPTLEVSDKYKLVSLCPLLKTLDGKDISLMRDAVNRLDSTMLQKITEIWKGQFYKKYNLLEGDKRTEFENEFIEKLKTEVTCGPAMLKTYREYKLTILGKHYLKKMKGEEKATEEPLSKKQKTTEVNGQPEENQTKVTSNAVSKMKDAKTPEGKVSKKRERTPRKEPKAESTSPVHCQFAVSHLLQTHSFNNDPTDRKTQVWGCEFEPDPERKGHTTMTCATCGGDSVCFIDCSTGRVMKKYKQPGETFYCLAWTTVFLDFDTDKKRKANLIAAGGYQNDIKIIEPNQLVCFEEIQGHKGVLECLIFHPHHPTWLLSAADDNTIMVWEIGLPKAAEYQGKSQLLLTLRSRSIVRLFSIPPHGKVVVGGCDDGCYLWKLFDSKDDKVDKTDKTRTYFGKLDFPGKKIIPLDSIVCLTDNLIATKRVEEGCIHIWYSESEMIKNDFRVAYRLPWRLTEVPFLKFNFVPACSVLLAGDDTGSVWLYDVESRSLEAKTKDKYDLKQTQVLVCPNETTKVFNQVSASSNLDYIVAVADTNVVCIWKRLRIEDGSPPS